MKYWAKRGKILVGPFSTRDEALAAFRERYPFDGPDYMARSKTKQILTGYGEDGPWFDLRWDDAK